MRDICHDLAAPVRHLKGLHPLVESSQGTEHEALRGLCDDAVLRMEALVKGIHQFARLDEDCRERQRLDLAALAQTEWRALERAGDTRTTKLVLSPLGWATAAREPIGFVFRELFENALRFGGERLGTIWVESRPAATGMVALSVSDDGLGVRSGDDYLRMFRATTQMHAPPLPRRAGMGLTSVARIVVCHGGTVTAQPGKPGLSVVFSLPRAPA